MRVLADKQGAFNRIKGCWVSGLRLRENNGGDQRLRYQGRRGRAFPDDFSLMIDI